MWQEFLPAETLSTIVYCSRSPVREFLPTDDCQSKFFSWFSSLSVVSHSKTSKPNDLGHIMICIFVWNYEYHRDQEVGTIPNKLRVCTGSNRVLYTFFFLWENQASRSCKNSNALTVYGIAYFLCFVFKFPFKEFCRAVKQTFLIFLLERKQKQARFNTTHHFAFIHFYSRLPSFIP